MKHPLQLPSDDLTDVSRVLPGSYGYAQGWSEAKRRKRKNPVGFVWPEQPKPKRKRSPR